MLFIYDSVFIENLGKRSIEPSAMKEILRQGSTNQDHHYNILFVSVSGATRSEERGCAPQTWEGDQRKVNGKWKLVNEIYDVYDEACKESTGDYQRATKAVECYCRGDLCNSASSLSISLALFIGIIVSFFIS